MFDTAGDRVDPVPADVVGGDFGCASVRSARLGQHPAQPGRASARPGSRRREQRLHQARRQQGPKLGQRTASVDDLQYSTQCRIGESGGRGVVRNGSAPGRCRRTEAAPLKDGDRWERWGTAESRWLVAENRGNSGRRGVRSGDCVGGQGFSPSVGENLQAAGEWRAWSHRDTSWRRVYSLMHLSREMDRCAEAKVVRTGYPDCLRIRCRAVPDQDVIDADQRRYPGVSRVRPGQTGTR